MRERPTKPKGASKKGDNESSNDGPSSTTRRSRAVRACKEESESKGTSKRTEGLSSQGRRRRTSSRSRSGDNGQEKGTPKTRSTDVPNSSASTQRSANRRSMSMRKLDIDAETSKPGKKKESDKNISSVETPTKRKGVGLRRDQGPVDDNVELASKVRTSPSDNSKETRSSRVTSGKPSRNVVEDKDNSASTSKVVTVTAPSNMSKDQDSESMDGKNRSSKSLPEADVRSDSETESERELSGEYVYVDTDDSEIKFNIKEVNKSPKTEEKCEVGEKNTSTQNAVRDENIDNNLIIDIGEAEDVKGTPDDTSKRSNENVHCNVDQDSLTSVAVSHDDVNTRSDENQPEGEIVCPAADFDLHLEDSFEKSTEVAAVNDEIDPAPQEAYADDMQPLTDKLDIQQTGEQELGEITKNESCAEQEKSFEENVDREHIDNSESRDLLNPTDEQTVSRQKNDSFWLDDHALSGGDRCVDEAGSETKGPSFQPAGDGDSCSTASTNNEVHNSPGLQQGKSKHRGPIRPGMDFTQGSRLEACDFLGKWYPAKIIDVDWKEHEVLIHFERWSSRFDEWVSMNSPRLRAITRTSARKEFRQKLQEVFKIGETVLARWVDGKMYPAKVAAFNPNGSFQVVFHDDGIQKTVKYTNITKLKEDQALQLSLNKVSAPLMPEKKKSIESMPSRSSSREKKPSKRTLSPDNSLSPSTRSPTKLLKKERVPDVQEQKTKKVVKNDKRSSAPNVTMRRKKLLVGGIFQAKRPQTEAESPKKTVAAQRTQSAGNRSKPAKRPRLESDVDPEVKESETQDDAAENAETVFQLTEESAVDGELDEDGQPRKKKYPGGHAPKEFIIEEDHNHFKCPIDDCGKGFRKETLLASHMKHYHKADNKSYGRRRNESEGSRGECVKASPVLDVAKEGLITEKQEAEKRNSRIKWPELQNKPEAIDPFAEFTSEIKEKEVKKVRTKPEHAPTKPRETVKKGVLGPRQKSEEAKQPGSQRRRTPSDTNKGEKRKLEPKAKAGPSHSLKEEDKDSAKSRSIKLKRRKVTSGAVKGVEKPVPESTEDECSFKTMTLDDEMPTSPVKETVVASPRRYEQPTTVQNVRRPGKKRKLALSASQPKEEPSSFVGDYGVLKSPNELAEFPVYEDDDDGGREEVVNCICRIREEDGLMMQCENCMAWQHGACFNIEEEDKVPNKYICFACQSPQGQRDSYRYWYDQDWWKVGDMACFNFLAKDHHPQPLSAGMYKTHALASSVYSVDHVLRSLRVKLDVAKNVDHTDLVLWNRPWTDGTQSGTSPSVLRSFNGPCNIKQKGELSYCDHSYSAPNRNVSNKQEAVSGNKTPSDFLSSATENTSSLESATLPTKNNLLETTEIASTPQTNSTTVQPHSLPTSLNENTTSTCLENVRQSEAALNQVTSADGHNSEVTSGSLEELSRDTATVTSAQTCSANSLEHQYVTDNKSDVIGDDGENSLLPQVKENGDLSSVPTSKSDEIVLKEENAASGVADLKPVPLILPVKMEPPSPATHHSKPLLNSVEDSVDAITCQMNLLDHIEQMQEELDRRLEEISQHVESLEMEYDIPAAASHRETLADLPPTKRLIRLMQFNLSKVERMATLQ